MDDTGSPRDDDLAETTRQQNSNLRRLIDAVGTLLAGSRELLQRLQPLGRDEPPDDTTRGPAHAGAPDDPPPDKQQSGERKS